MSAKSGSVKIRCPKIWHASAGQARCCRQVGSSHPARPVRPSNSYRWIHLHGEHSGAVHAEFIRSNFWLVERAPVAISWCYPSCELALNAWCAYWLWQMCKLPPKRITVAALRVNMLPVELRLHFHRSDHSQSSPLVSAAAVSI